MNTGQKVWMRTFESHNWGPVLTTGGGLVFAGGTTTATSVRRRQDRRTALAVAHELRITGVPSSYAVDGVQYVAVQSGWASTRSACRVRSMTSWAPNRRPTGRRDLGLRRQAIVTPRVERSRLAAVNERPGEGAVPVHARRVTRADGDHRYRSCAERRWRNAFVTLRRVWPMAAAPTRPKASRSRWREKR